MFEEIDHISVSQLKTLRRNPRRWIMEKLYKLPTCKSSATDFGSELHNHFEAYQLYGKDTCFTKTGLIADLWDKYQEHPLHIKNEGVVSVELPIELELEGLPKLVGIIDVLQRRDLSDNTFTIYDYKTSSSKKYRLTSEELAKDPQMVVYAEWVFRNYDFVEKITVGHVNICYKLKRDPVDIVTAELTREETAEKFAAIEAEFKALLEEALRWKQGAGELENIPTTRCEKCNCSFGPNSCEFSPICCGQATAEEYKKAHESLEEKTIYNLKDQLTKNKEEGIINSMSRELKPLSAKTLDLAAVVSKAREANNHIKNVWDRREAVTAVVIEAVRKLQPEVLVAPSHFEAGSIDPDYVPIFTQLKELDFKIMKEI